MTLPSATTPALRDLAAANHLESGGSRTRDLTTADAACLLIPAAL